MGNPPLRQRPKRANSKVMESWQPVRPLRVPRLTRAMSHGHSRQSRDPKPGQLGTSTTLQRHRTNRLLARRAGLQWTLNPVKPLAVNIVRAAGVAKAANGPAEISILKRQPHRPYPDVENRDVRMGRHPPATTHDAHLTQGAKRYRNAA